MSLEKFIESNKLSEKTIFDFFDINPTAYAASDSESRKALVTKNFKIKIKCLFKTNKNNKITKNNPEIVCLVKAKAILLEGGEAANVEEINETWRRWVKSTLKGKNKAQISIQVSAQEYEEILDIFQENYEKTESVEKVTEQQRFLIPNNIFNFLKIDLEKYKNLSEKEKIEEINIAYADIVLYNFYNNKIKDLNHPIYIALSQAKAFLLQEDNLQNPDLIQQSWQQWLGSDNKISTLVARDKYEIVTSLLYYEYCCELEKLFDEHFPKVEEKFNKKCEEKAYKAFKSASVDSQLIRSLAPEIKTVKDKSYPWYKKLGVGLLGASILLLPVAYNTHKKLLAQQKQAEQEFIETKIKEKWQEAPRNKIRERSEAKDKLKKSFITQISQKQTSKIFRDSDSLFYNNNEFFNQVNTLSNYYDAFSRRNNGIKRNGEKAEFFINFENKAALLGKTPQKRLPVVVVSAPEYKHETDNYEKQQEIVDSMVRKYDGKEYPKLPAKNKETATPFWQTSASTPRESGFAWAQVESTANLVK